ncbi:MAG: prolyl oligopeptidase family serine peptidase [Deltaproteobacteria bacterium]|nr:prolyl oligopeptidase family serine peptidase [Deltaproteobacteria bacterium]
MKKLLSFFSIIAIMAMMPVFAHAGSAKMVSEATLSFPDGQTPATIEIYPGEPVLFDLDITAIRSSFPRVYVVPVIKEKNPATGELIEKTKGAKYLTDICLHSHKCCDHKIKNLCRQTKVKLPPAAKSKSPLSCFHRIKCPCKEDGDTGIFSSDDLDILFARSDVYEIYLQIWDQGKRIGRSNAVTVTVIERPFTGVVFTGKRAPVYTPQWAVERYNWTVIADGIPQVLPVLPSAYTFDGMFLTASLGIYNRTAEYDEGTPISTPVTEYPGIIQGYSLNRAVDNRITLGIEDIEYTFADDARIYRIDSQFAEAGFEISINDIPFSWNGRYWLLLNSWGKISHMFVSFTDSTTPPTYPGAAAADSTNPTTANLKQLEIVKKFTPSEGPVDPVTGLSIEYASFVPHVPSSSPNGKFPLLVWLHGSGGGANVWSSLINDTGLTKFADIYQPLFAAGGAYVMVPRSNEDFAEGHAMRWNQKQVEPLFRAIDEFISENPDVDTDRVYLGGFSIGGGMVWLAIRERPDFFAAAFPVAPPGRFMPDPDSDEINNFVSLPLWIVHSVEDTIVRVDNDTQVSPPIQWGSRPVMNRLIPLAAESGTDSRLTLLHPVYYLGGHLEVQAVFNNMVNPYTGTLYANGLTMSDPYTDRVKSTLIQWLNEQSALNN